MPIIDDIKTIIDTPWDIRKGTVVPTTEQVLLTGGAVEMEATFLYADLANSTGMVKTFNQSVTAKIIKCFLSTVTKLIRDCDGAIGSFDGDRVMGIFIGNSKNSNAAKCALQIKYAVGSIITPFLKEEYPSIANAPFEITYGCGIDTSDVIAIRAGARGNNDLVWIGTAPNLAAKLSDIREETYTTFITEAVYYKLNDDSKYSNGNDMWRKLEISKENLTVYTTSYHWEVK